MLSQRAIADPELVRLDPGALGAAKSLLYTAYRHEPTFQYLFDASRPGYDQRVRATIREGIELHFSNQQDAIGLVAEGAEGAQVATRAAAEVENSQRRRRLDMPQQCGDILADVVVAVAFISRPELRMNLAEQLNWRVRMILTAGLSSTRRYIEYHRQVTECLPGDVHHHLPLLGVHPQHQSRGYGRQLMLAVEKICRESPRSAGIGLDTGNSRYLKFYESLGYRKVGEVKLGKVSENVLFKACV